VTLPPSPAFREAAAASDPLDAREHALEPLERVVDHLVGVGH
jgi:hypothetical protein